MGETSMEVHKSWLRIVLLVAHWMIQVCACVLLFQSVFKG